MSQHTHAIIRFDEDTVGFDIVKLDKILQDDKDESIKIATEYQVMWKDGHVYKATIVLLGNKEKCKKKLAFMTQTTEERSSPKKRKNRQSSPSKTPSIKTKTTKISSKNTSKASSQALSSKDALNEEINALKECLEERDNLIRDFKFKNETLNEQVVRLTNDLEQANNRYKKLKNEIGKFIIFYLNLIIFKTISF